MRRMALVSAACCVAVVLVVMLTVALIAPALARGNDENRSPANVSGDVITMSEARVLADDFLMEAGYTTLVAGDVIEFSNHFYVQVMDTKTGAGALELVVSRDGATVHPAPGPGMMWNTEYSPMPSSSGAALHEAMMPNMHQDMMGTSGMHQDMMGNDGMHRGMADSMPSDMMQGQEHGHDGSMPSTLDMGSMCPYSMTKPTTGATLSKPLNISSAMELVQSWLDDAGANLTAGDANEFPGYFTMHTVDTNGETVGLVSVNTSTGQVWEHSWHGSYLTTEHSR